MRMLAILALIALLLFLWVRRRRRLGRPLPRFGRRQLSRLQLDIGGEQRMALVPRTADASGQAPLLLCFHGGLGDPNRFAQNSGLAARAKAQGFLAVFPAAPEGWADGRPERDDPTSDFAFVEALIDKLARDGLIDPSQVYALGISNGGMFVQRLASERAELLAGAGAILATIPLPMLETVAAGPPLPFVLICDHDDQIMPWHGGEIARGPNVGIGGRVVAVDDALAVWLDRNRARPAGAPVHIPGPTGWGAEIHDFAASEGGAPVRFVAVTGAGHRWPRWPGMRGAGAFDAGEIALDFFAGMRPGAARNLQDRLSARV